MRESRHGEVRCCDSRGLGWRVLGGGARFAWLLFQGDTLDEVLENIREAIAGVLESNIQILDVAV